MEQRAASRTVSATRRFTAQWQSTHVLSLVREVNTRCLDALVAAARSDTSNEIGVVVQFRTLWRELTGDAKERAASIPLVMFNVEFQNVDWWRSACARSTKSDQPIPRFPTRVAAELTREILTVAWHTARTDQYAATVLIGMSPDVATLIAEFGVHDIENVATRHSHFIRPRWESTPWMWRNLLIAANTGDMDALHDVHLHALQLLGNELSSKTAVALAPGSQRFQR